jgi:hypothetical protein
MNFPCRMQAYVSKELGKDILYLSLMLLTERTIAGYDIPNCGRIAQFSTLSGHLSSTRHKVP